MDGWMDGWMGGQTGGRNDEVDLTIIMMCLLVAIWTLYKRCGPLTCDDLRAGSIASRNSLRSASLLGAIFEVLEVI